MDSFLFILCALFVLPGLCQTNLVVLSLLILQVDGDPEYAIGAAINGPSGLSSVWYSVPDGYLNTNVSFFVTFRRMAAFG